MLSKFNRLRTQLDNIPKEFKQLHQSFIQKFF